MAAAWCSISGNAAIRAQDTNSLAGPQARLDEIMNQPRSHGAEWSVKVVSLDSPGRDYGFVPLNFAATKLEADGTVFHVRPQ